MSVDGWRSNDSTHIFIDNRFGCSSLYWPHAYTGPWRMRRMAELRHMAYMTCCRPAGWTMGVVVGRWWPKTAGPWSASRVSPSTGANYRPSSDLPNVHALPVNSYITPRPYPPQPPTPTLWAFIYSSTQVHRIRRPQRSRSDVHCFYPTLVFCCHVAPKYPTATDKQSSGSGNKARLRIQTGDPSRVRCVQATDILEGEGLVLGTPG